jgi:hypothetical protein
MHWNCNSLENLRAVREFPIPWPGPKHDVAICRLSIAEERLPHHVKIDDGIPQIAASTALTSEELNRRTIKRTASRWVLGLASVPDCSTGCLEHATKPITNRPATAPKAVALRVMYFIRWAQVINGPRARSGYHLIDMWSQIPVSLSRRCMLSPSHGSDHLA